MGRSRASRKNPAFLGIVLNGSKKSSICKGLLDLAGEIQTFFSYIFILEGRKREKYQTLQLDLELSRQCYTFPINLELCPEIKAFLAPAKIVRTPITLFAAVLLEVGLFLIVFAYSARRRVLLGPPVTSPAQLDLELGLS